MVGYAGMEFPVVAEISQPPRAGPTAERPIASAKGTQEKLATHVSTQAAQSHAMAASESDRSWWSSAFARCDWNVVSGPSTPAVHTDRLPFPLSPTRGL